MEASERDAMVEVALTHASVEADGDLEATMATLEDDPVYELLPMRRLLRGRDATRAYYEHFFAHFLPRVAGYELRNEWVTDEGLGQEYTMDVVDDEGATRSHTIIGILTFGSSGKLSGERLYASDEVLGMMFGPVLDRTTPI